MPLSEHVYCMGIAFKMTEYSNKSASNFVLSLNILHRGNVGESEGHSYGQLVMGSFIRQTHPFMHHVSCRVFLQNIKSPRWFSPPTVQIWPPATSGFSQN